MKKEHFYPYRDVIKRCINSCVSTEQLFCCHDMIDRFKEVFLYHIIEQAEMNAVLDELSALYLQKSHELHIY